MGDLTIFNIPVSIGTMVYQAVLFTVLFVLLKKFVVQKLVNVLDTRKESIENQLALAEKYQSEGESFVVDKRELLEKARIDAREIVKKSQIDAQNIIKMAKEEAAMIHTQAYNEVLNNKRKRDAG